MAVYGWNILWTNKWLQHNSKELSHNHKILMKVTENYVNLNVLLWFWFLKFSCLRSTYGFVVLIIESWEILYVGWSQTLLHVFSVLNMAILQTFDGIHDNFLIVEIFIHGLHAKQ
jgi:hypothetical protein